MTLAGALVALGLAAAPAQARTATWVSGKGADSGGCSFSAPCRSFAYAITQTDPGGEIDVLDSAGYGILTIDKAISIVNDGSLAKVSVGSGATGIIISAGPNDAIHLRGLSIEGDGVGAIGVQFNAGGSLNILNCVVRNFTTDGIYFAPTTSSTFSIVNSFVADIVGTGIDIRPVGSAVISGVIDGVIVRDTITGIALKGFGFASTSQAYFTVNVVNSVVDNSSAYGFYAASGDLPQVRLSLRNVSASNNGIGVYASGAQGFVLLAHSAIVGDTLERLTWKIDNGATIFTSGDNQIDTGGIGALSSLALR
jgi:hypothetical protein